MAPEVKAYARGFARFFTGVGPRRAAAAWARPGGAGAGFVRADGYCDDGYGGRKLGVDASARAARCAARSSSRGG